MGGIYGVFQCSFSKYPLPSGQGWGYRDEYHWTF